MSVSHVETLSIASKFVRSSLAVQHTLASKVAQALKKNVYIYDSSSTFNGMPYSIIDDIRYQLAKDGRIGVLSRAAQETIPNKSTYITYLGEHIYGSDDNGVFVIFNL